jgi:hypothetical protein
MAMAEKGSTHRRTLSAPSHAALDRLTRSTGDLLETLDAVAAGADPDTVDGCAAVADNVRRYLALLIEGRTADDAGIALHGANLLTTVNKGVGDAEITSEERVIAERAFTVTKDAIYAARHLRADAGMAF